MKKLTGLFVFLCLLFTIGSFVSAHSEDDVSHEDNGINKELAEVRKATAKYHDVEKALEDGYINTGEFALHPELGGMGIHFINPRLMGDEEINPTEPEVLLYAPKKNGGYKLVGVEYYVPTNLASSHPTIFGKEFDGPMLNHEYEHRTDLDDEFINDPVNQHYDFHAWIWQANPSGIFASFNPNVKPTR